VRLVFAGTPEFAAVHLAALVNAGEQVVAVYTQPDRPAGRGQRLRESPVKQLATARGIPVLQPQTLRDAGAPEVLARLAPDLMVVVAYGLILPRAILATPRLGCVNVHASRLPRWRGAAPIQRAILAGDAESGVSLMQMDEGLDTGPVLREVRCPIGPRDTAATLHDRLAALGAEALVGLLRDLRAGPLTAAPQPAEGVTYARKVEREEAELVWTEAAAALDRRVRAFNPWPVARTTLAGEVLKVWEAEPLPATGTSAGQPGEVVTTGGSPTRQPREVVTTVGSPARRPGEIIAASRDGLDVATGEGVLRVLTLQLPGGRPIRAADYLNAHPSPVGQVLGAEP
jgi:methionyl-tRNA formyltransferase